MWRIVKYVQSCCVEDPSPDRAPCELIEHILLVLSEDLQNLQVEKKITCNCLKIYNYA